MRFWCLGGSLLDSGVFSEGSVLGAFLPVLGGKNKNKIKKGQLERQNVDQSTLVSKIILN